MSVNLAIRVHSTSPRYSIERSGSAHCRLPCSSIERTQLGSPGEIDTYTPLHENWMRDIPGETRIAQISGVPLHPFAGLPRVIFATTKEAAPGRNGIIHLFICHSHNGACDLETD